MSSFMPSDETVRVTWINEFRDETHGMAAAMRRAQSEYEKVASEQHRTNALSLQDARERSRAVQQEFADRRTRLTELQAMGRNEEKVNQRVERLNADRADKERVIADRSIAIDKRVAESKELTERKIVVATEKSRKQRVALDESHTKNVQRISDRIKKIEQDNARIVLKITDRSVRDRNAITKKLNEDRLKFQYKGQAKIDRDARARDDKADVVRDAAARILAIRDGSASELAELRKALKKAQNEKKTALRDDAATRKSALSVLVKDLEAERDAYASGLKNKRDADNARTRELIANIDKEIELNKSKIKRLGQLQAEFGPHISQVVRGKGRGPTRVSAAETMLDFDFIKGEVAAERLRSKIAQVRQEAINNKRVSHDSFQDMIDTADRAGLSFSQLSAHTREAGFEINNFADAKRREIVFLRDNTKEMGRHSHHTGRAAKAMRGLQNAVRFSTNEMIVFRQTARLLMIPILASAVEVLARAIMTLVGGLVALSSTLAPLAGQVAGLVPLVFSAAQVMGVWKIATDNLGKAANNLSKIVQVSLTGVTKDYQKLLSQLPPQAKKFAQTLHSMSGGFRAFREELSARVFTGLDAFLKGARPTIQALRGELVRTAGVIRTTFAQLGRMLGSARWTVDLRTQAKNTNDWLVRLRPAIKNVSEGLRNITVEAAPLIDHVVELTNRFGRWFKGLTDNRTQMAHFFRESNFVFDQWLSILGQFGQALLNIGRIAYNVLGRQMLMDLRRVTTEFRKWTESTRGKNTLVTYFRQVKAPLYETARLFRDLVKALALVGKQKGFEHLVNTLRVGILPNLVSLLQHVQAGFTPALMKTLNDLIKFLTDLTSAGGPFTQMVVWFGRIVAFVDYLITEVPLLKTAFLYIITAVTIIRTLRFAAVISGFSLAVRGAAALGGALGKSATEATALNAALARLGVTARALPAAVPITAAGVFTGGKAGGAMPGSTIGQRARSFASLQGGQLGSMVGGAALIGGQFIGGTKGNVISAAGAGAMIGGMAGPEGAVIGALVGVAAGLTIFRDRTDKAAEALKNFATEAGRRRQTARERVREGRQQLPDARIQARYAANDLETSRTRLIQLREAGATPKELQGAVLDYDAANLRLQDSLKAVSDLEAQIVRGRKYLLSSTKGITDQVLNLANNQKGGKSGSGFLGDLFNPKSWDPTKKSFYTMPDDPTKSEDFQARLTKLAEGFKDTDPVLRRAILRVRNFSKEIKGLPSEKKIKILLTVPTAFIKQRLQNAMAPLLEHAQKLAKTFGDRAGRSSLLESLLELTEKYKKDGDAQMVTAIKRATALVKAWDKLPKDATVLDLVLNMFVQKYENVPTVLPSDSRETGGGTGSTDATGGGGGARTKRKPLPTYSDTEKWMARFEDQIRGLATSALSAMRVDLDKQVQGLRAKVKAGTAGKRASNLLALLEQELTALDNLVTARLQLLTDAIQESMRKGQVRFDRASQRLARRDIEADSPGGLQYMLASYKNLRAVLQNALTRAKKGLDDARAWLLPAIKAAHARGDAEAEASFRAMLKTYIDTVVDIKGQIFQNATDILTTARQKVLAALQRKTDIANTREQIFEATQRLQGTYDSGGVARAEFMRSQVLPKLKDQERDALKEYGAKSLKYLEAHLAVLNMQVEIQNAIKDNTDQVAKNTGNLSFEFQGQRFTDMVGLGVGM